MHRQSDKGTVYLVGAGPGDPELITVKGLRLLRVADVVAYDRLIHPALLEKARPSAELIYVGKAAGCRAHRQEDINQTLIDHARLGRVVVRLKGGDPFVFGRGSEECLALAAAGVPYEVVPGITSPIAVPAYAGIPVTHRGVSSSFTVVTGHTCASGEEPDWTALSKAGTLIVLMGLKRLPQIAAALLESGRSPGTPAAVVEAGTTDGQRTVTGTLADIASLAQHLEPPATIIVGEVVSLRPWTAWVAEHHSPASAVHSRSPAAVFQA